MIEKIVNNYYDMVVESVVKETGAAVADVQKGFNEELRTATAKVAIVIGSTVSDDEPHILYVDLKAFKDALRTTDIDKFNRLIQEKAGV